MLTNNSLAGTDSARRRGHFFSESSEETRDGRRVARSVVIKMKVWVLRRSGLRQSALCCGIATKESCKAGHHNATKESREVRRAQWILINFREINIAGLMGVCDFVCFSRLENFCDECVSNMVLPRKAVKT